MTRLIGLIGGVSWESTVLYYQLINQAVREKLGGLHSARLLISSLDYAPIVQWERENNWQAIEELLVAAALQLESAGSEYIFLACNTLHKLAPALEKALTIPFIHIVDPVGEALVQAGIKKVGLLGTQFTMEEGFYAERLQEKFKLEVITPELEQRLSLDKLIYEELCVGKVLKSSQSFMRATVEALAQRGAQGLIFGCTEFKLLELSAALPLPVFDSTVLHTQKAVTLALRE